jgi:hypothetical protein
MEKNVRSKNHETNDPEHLGIRGLAARDRIRHLDGADLETGAQR